MSTKDLRALEHRFFEDINKGKAAGMAIIDEKYATDLLFHMGTGVDVRGLNGFKQIYSATHDAFPDNHTTLDDMVVEGDKAVVRYTTTGTHKGAFMGIPPTNKKVTFSTIEIDRFAGGKVVEAWERYDTLSIMQQLGVIPTPKK
jgi:predicted ester cyclase